MRFDPKSARLQRKVKWKLSIGQGAIRQQKAHSNGLFKNELLGKLGT